MNSADEILRALSVQVKMLAAGKIEEIKVIRTHRGLRLLTTSKREFEDTGKKAQG